MSRPLLVLSALPLALSAAEARAAPIPTASYRVEASAGSWQPLAPADIAKTIEQAALEVLSRPGLMQVKKHDPKKEPTSGAEYTLEIKGRLLDEAETHTVYLSFGSGTKSDLPSFQASDTVSLATRSKGEMLGRVEKSARKAAGQLLEALRPALEQAQRGRDNGSTEILGERGALPYQWGDVEIPTAKLSAGSADLDSKKAEERQASLRLLTSLVLQDDAPARHLLESCALKHPLEEMRVGCLKALAPASRRIAPTQRVVIEALRKDKSSDVQKEASEQMLYFSGVARDEAIQAWLEATAKGNVLGPINQLGDLPNLDVAIHRCMLSCGQRPKYQRGKSSCIPLAAPLSHQRRRAVFWKFIKETNPESPYYLEGAGEGEGSRGTDWQRAVEAVLERAVEWDPELEEILWKRYQREMSSFAIDALADQGAPTERLADRLLEALQTGGPRASVPGLERIAKANPALRLKIREKVAELLHTGSFPKTVRKEQLQRLVDDLGKEKGS